MARARIVPASMWGELRQAVHANRHLTADDRRKRFASARKRDVVDAVRWYAYGFGDETREDLIASAGRSAAPRQRFGPTLQRLDKVSEGVKGGARRNRNHFILARQTRDWRDVIQGDRRPMRHDSAEHDQARHHQRVGVAALGADETREPIVPAAPGMFSTGAVRTRPARWSTCCMTRAVWSQPPPGAAGAIIRSWGMMAARRPCQPISSAHVSGRGRLQSQESSMATRRKSMRACAACACFAFVATPTAKIDTRWTSSGSGPT